jgi:hypothetical protein
VFRNSGYFFVGVLGLALLAFWPQYLSRLAGGGISGYVHFHAVVMALWLGLLIVQPFLLRAGRRRLHRALGALSYGLAPAIVVAGILMAHAVLVRDGEDDFAGAGATLYLPLSMIALFAVTYKLAIAYRKAPALHARFMICTCLGLVDPITGRVLAFYFAPLDHPLYYQVVSFVLTAGALSVLIFAERRQRRGRGVFPAMLGATALVYGLWFTLAQSTAWLGVARWFRGLPLT